MFSNGDDLIISYISILLPGSSSEKTVNVKETTLCVIPAQCPKLINHLIVVVKASNHNIILIIIVLAKHSCDSCMTSLPSDAMMYPAFFYFVKAALHWAGIKKDPLCREAVYVRPRNARGVALVYIWRHFK